MKRRNFITAVLFSLVVVCFAIVIIANKPGREEWETKDVFPLSTIATLPPVNTAFPQATPTLQQTGKVTFYYNLTKVIREEMFGGTYVDHEILTFTHNPDGKWSTEQATPQFLNFGPLYKHAIYEWPSSLVGNCPINTYHDNTNGLIGSFNPLCTEINSKEAATLTIGLLDCDIDGYENIICTKDGIGGQLHYKLNKELNLFTFNFTGFWNDDQYPSWINQATQTLGFPPVAENFYKDLVAGQNYTIYKKP